MHGPGTAPDDDVFDGARYVLRARRVADLSQRELADILGVSRATVGRIESGAARVDTGTLCAILALAGLRLAVLDAAGREVAPVPMDVLRDHGGRRFPSHLDALPAYDMPASRGANPRKGKPDAKGWFRQREGRERARERTGVPLDHPTVSGLRAQRREAYWTRAAAAVAREALNPRPECSCLDECFELACVSECLCQCEPDHHRRRSARSEPDEPA